MKYSANMGWIDFYRSAYARLPVPRIGSILKDLDHTAGKKKVYRSQKRKKTFAGWDILQDFSLGATIFPSAAELQKKKKSVRTQPSGGLNFKL